MPPVIKESRKPCAGLGTIHRLVDCPIVRPQSFLASMRCKYDVGHTAATATMDFDQRTGELRAISFWMWRVKHHEHEDREADHCPNRIPENVFLVRFQISASRSAILFLN